MVTRIASTVAAVGLSASPALGACTGDTLAEVASDGEILITASGQMYHVLPGYDFYSQSWLPTEKIIICDDALVWFDAGGRQMIYAIINKDENAEHVSAFKGR